MATIEKRSHYWRAKVRCKSYPVQTRSFDTRALAERWARDIERDMDRNVFVDRTEADKNTLRDFIQRYLNEVTPTKRGADKEAVCLRALMRDPIAQTTMSALSSRRIAEYRDQRLQTVSPSTVNKALNHLAHIIETGRRERGIALPENPVRLVRRPRAGPPRDRRFVGEEEQSLFEACEDARNLYLRPVIQFALETGMRQGEILSLQWKHINLTKRVAHLPLTKNGEARSTRYRPPLLKRFGSFPVRSMGVCSRTRQKQSSGRLSSPLVEPASKIFIFTICATRRPVDFSSWA